MTNAFILMLTSGEHYGDLARCRELGISTYLTKPVRRAELRAAIVRATMCQSDSRRSAEAQTEITVEHVPERQARTGSYVLLVEDNVVNQRVARAILERAGHSVMVADNGGLALSLLEEQSFDLILMDVQMPGMDGFKATSSIREQERRFGGHSPIVAMTAHAMTGDRERCIEAGMDDYISKPIHSPTLLALVDKYCKMAQPV